MSIFSNIFSFGKKAASKVRTQWLISFVIFYLVFIGLSFFYCDLLCKWLGIPGVSCSSFCLFYPFLILFSAVPVYYFAYKKNGTKWLMFTIIKMYMWIVMSLCLIGLAAYGCYMKHFHETINSMALIGIISFVLMINCAYFLINCYRLYKANQVK